jgi:TM2 domain-containing membrane protein YozV
MPLKNKIRLILFLVFIFFNQQSLPQNVFYSDSSRTAFADFLFCSGDFEFAINEYTKISSFHSDDIIKFKTAYAYSRLGDIDKGKSLFKSISGRLKTKAEEQIILADFLSGNFDKNYQSETNAGVRFYLLNSIYSNKNVDNQILTNFNNVDSEIILKFSTERRELDQKSLFLAGLYSALVPGSGKIYTGQIGDGITAFIATSLLTFLSVDNFKHNHNFRGYLFGTLAAVFYGGNVYGSAVSAHQYNLKTKYEWEQNFNSFIEQKNYFINEPEFLKCR